MNLERLSSLVSRVFFFGAFALLALAVLEKLANVAGFTIIRERFAPSVLLQYAATLLVFVIALLLRQLREQGGRKP